MWAELYPEKQDEGHLLWGGEGCVIIFNNNSDSNNKLTVPVQNQDGN